MGKKELLNQINAKVEEVRSLAAEDKLEEAKAAKAELQKLQDKFDLVKDLDDEPEPVNLKPAGKNKEFRRNGIY